MIKKILSVMLGCMLFVSCNNCTNPHPDGPDVIENDSVDITFENYSYTDSVQIGETYSYFDMHLMIPVGNSKLNKSINEWLSKIVLTNDSTPIADYNELLKHECEVFFADNKDDAKEALESGSFPNPWSYTLETKSYNVNYTFVTIEVDGYYHIGGAHGTPIILGATFNRFTGERATYENVINDKKALASVVTYSMAHGEDRYPVDELCEDLECTVQTFPLPEYDPYIDEDGFFVFQYQAYEIGPYALGCPRATVPFYDIYNLLKEPFNQILPIVEDGDEDFDEE